MKKLSLGKVKYFLKMIDSKGRSLSYFYYPTMPFKPIILFIHPSTHLLIQQLLIKCTKTRDF